MEIQKITVLDIARVSEEIKVVIGAAIQQQIDSLHTSRQIRIILGYKHFGYIVLVEIQRLTEAGYPAVPERINTHNLDNFILTGTSSPF